MGAKKDLKKLKRKVNRLESSVEEYGAKVESRFAEVEALLAEFSLKITGLLQTTRKAPVAASPAKRKVKKRK
jgi:hypothetical protein